MNKLILILLLLFLSACTTTTPQMTLFKATPAYEKIDQSIIQSDLLKNAYPPKVRELNYESKDLLNQNFYSNYQIRLIKTTNLLTEYQTTELTHHTATLFGHGVGYGGIISIAYRKTGDLYNQKNYYKKYQWTHISNIQGHLFPLKVGNQLSFDYQDAAANSAKNDVGTSDHGKIVYEVIGYSPDYHNSNIKVPGATYIIKFSKTTTKDPSLALQNIYHFSTSLGWYVQAKYFYHNKAIAEYYLVNKK